MDLRPGRSCGMTRAPCLAWLLLAGCAHASRPPPAADAIDVDLREVPIHDAFRAIAKRARINLSVDPDVTGTVTLAVRAPARAVLDTIAKQHALRIDPAGPVLHLSNATTPASPPKEYTGTPIDTSFDATPVRAVAKTFSDFANVRIAVDDDVEVAITQRVRNVPWDLALEHIARKYGLRVVRDGASIRLANRLAKP